jgi:3-deoxy-D-manno-octulosonic-acid transferase
MYLLYSLVLTLLFLALLPYFAYQAARHGKYAGSFLERLGFLPETAGGDGRRTIWVHAVSVGEFLAARLLIERLKNELPNHRIVVSTTTLAGQRLARSQSASFDSVIYFPFDWRFSVRRSLSKVDPWAVIILETELWPNFLRECNRRGVTTVLANGRISERSYRRYRMIGRPLRRVIEDFSLMIMQSEADAERARQLGAPSARVHVCGNLKYDFGVGESSIIQVSESATRIANLRTHDFDRDCLESFQTSENRSATTAHPLIVAGSTAPGEEEILLAALQEVRTHTGLEGTRLLLAPRHPERFDEVAHLLRRSQFKFVRRSDKKVSTASSTVGSSESLKSGRQMAELSTEEGSCDVLLLDTIGELASLYRLASVVFVGGSLVPRGGHNMIEPAAFAKPIIVGPHTENFRQVISDFLKDDAVVQIQSRDALSKEIRRLLSEPEKAQAMGDRARNILAANRGAAERTVALIKELVSNPS